MPEDLLAHNRQLIEEFRTAGGFPERPLLLLTTTGRRTGRERTSPMMFVRDDDRILVIASNAGAADHPQWYRNLVADPRVTVELPGRRLTARAEPLTGADYDRAWATIKQGFPFFADHEVKAGDRRIPVVALIPAPDGEPS